LTSDGAPTRCCADGPASNFTTANGEGERGGSELGIGREKSLAGVLQREGGESKRRSGGGNGGWRDGIHGEWN
jgi:hypothetical protein